MRAQLAKAGVNVLIVHGDPGHYNALAYLTNFTPKNGTGLALVPREGPLRILSSGTPKMMDAAKRLTWVEDVRPLGNAPKTVAGLVGDGDALATWAFGTLPQAIHAGIARAVTPRALLSLDEGPGALLLAGAVYAVTSSATEGGETAYAPALIAVTEDGCEELWRQTA